MEREQQKEDFDPFDYMSDVTMTTNKTGIHETLIGYMRVKRNTIHPRIDNTGSWEYYCNVDKGCTGRCRDNDLIHYVIFPIEEWKRSIKLQEEKQKKSRRDRFFMNQPFTRGHVDCRKVLMEKYQFPCGKTHYSTQESSDCFHCKVATQMQKMIDHEYSLLEKMPSVCLECKIAEKVKFYANAMYENEFTRLENDRNMIVVGKINVT